MPVTPTKNAQCKKNNGRRWKLRFETREDAVHYREELLATGMYARGSIGAYNCKHCPFFHVAHRRQSAAIRGGRRDNHGKRR